MIQRNDDDNDNRFPVKRARIETVRGDTHADDALAEQPVAGDADDCADAFWRAALDRIN